MVHGHPANDVPLIQAEPLSECVSKGDHLHVLVQRRAAIIERLAGDVDDSTFNPPTIEEFGETLTDDGNAVFLSPAEALILDLALAKQDEAIPWLSYKEAETLFGERAVEATRDLGFAQDAHQRSIGRLVAVLSMACALATWTGLIDVGWKSAIAAALAVAVASTGLAIAALFLRAGGAAEKMMEALFSLFGSSGILAGLIALNKHMRHPFLHETAGLIVDIALAAVVFAFWQLGQHVVRGRREQAARSGGTLSGSAR